MMVVIFYTFTVNFYFFTRKEKSSKLNVLLLRKILAGRKETPKAPKDIIYERKSLETFSAANRT